MITQPRYINKAINIVLPFFLIFSLFIMKPLFAQKQGFIIPDSLRNMSYEELRKGFQINRNDFLIVDQYLKAFRVKGEIENNVEKIAESFHLKSFIEENFEKKIQYLDSSIFISEGFYYKEYPARAFLSKALLFEKKFEYDSALENYTLALEYADKNSNLRLVSIINYLIGLIKIDTGEYDSAKALFKECGKYYSENIGIRDDLYLYNIFALSEISYRENKLDSCTYFNKIGLTESLICEKPEMQNYFVLNESMVQFKRKNYAIAIDSLTSIIPFFIKQEDYSNTIVSYYYLGKSYNEIDRKEKGISYLIKMDSLFQFHPYYMYEERKGYDDIIEYYESKKDLQRQLLYIKKTIKVDSFLNTQGKTMLRETNLKYDTPILLQEKEKLIKTLNKSKINLSRKLLTLFLALALSLGGLLWLFNKNRNYKNKYDDLLNSRKDKKPKADSKPKTIDSISEKQVARIIEQLNKFEKNLEYLNNEISLAKTATFLGTNSSYLSKVINYYKSQNFSAYINELRIEYALEKIPNDKKLLNYTITALAHEFGYNNSESFSKAFYAKTGIYPSFYIKQLKNVKN